MLSRCLSSSPANRSRRVISARGSSPMSKRGRALRGAGVRDAGHQVAIDLRRDQALVVERLVAADLPAQRRLPQEPGLERGGVVRILAVKRVHAGLDAVEPVGQNLVDHRLEPVAEDRPRAFGRVAGQFLDHQPHRQQPFEPLAEPLGEEPRIPRRRCRKYAKRNDKGKASPASAARLYPSRPSARAPSTIASALRISACTTAGEAVRRGERLQHQRPLLVAEGDQRNGDALVVGQGDSPTARRSAAAFIHASIGRERAGRRPRIERVISAVLRISPTASA